jgi:LPS-assembly protein
VRSRLALAAAFTLVATYGGAAVVAPGTVTLHARNQQWVEELTWCGEGDVEVKYQDVTVKCDRVQVDLRTMRMDADGNVVFDQGETRLGCDRMSFDLDHKVGTMYVVKGFLPPTYYFRGDQLEKLDDTHWRLTHGVFSSCNLDTDNSPPWSINISDGILELEGYGHFRGVTLRTNGVPFFYTPRLLWPIKRDRATGFLVPSVGYNSRYGAFLGNSFYWPISRSSDSTTYLDWWSKGYYGIGEEFRLTPAENAGGQVLGNLVRDSLTNTWEWKVRGEYTQLFPGGYALRGQLLNMSNIDFFQQFERVLDQNALRTLLSNVTMSRTWGPQAFNLRVESNETYFAVGTGSTAVTLERKPEVEYRLASWRLGLSPLYLSMVGIADELRMDRSPAQRGRYGRFDLFPNVSVLMPSLPWLNITPSVGARMTYYTSSYATNGALVPDPLTRHYLTTGLALVGPSFSRVWYKADGSRVKHLIEPRLIYSYVSNPGDQSKIPVFDEKDSVLVTNQVQAILSNHVLVKSKDGSSREVALVEFGQNYSLSGPLTFARPPFPSSKRGPFSIAVRVLPQPQMALDARAEFDAVTKKLSSTAFSGNAFLGKASANLTWYTSINPINGAVLSSQTRAMLAYGPNEAKWRAEAQLAYDIHTGQMLEQRYAFRWRGSCWAVWAEVRDYTIVPNQTRDYRITIDFTGLGTLFDIRGGLGSLGL